MQRTQIGGIFLIGAVLCLGIVVKFTGKNGNDRIIEAISDCTDKGRWKLPRKSKYFTYNYNEGSKLKAYAESSGWPGDLERGFGKEYLENALQLANSISANRYSEIRINKEWKKEAINIYFFDSRESTPFEIYKDNCAYLGFKNIVICDINLIRNISLIDYIEKELDSMLDGRHFSTILDDDVSYRKLVLLRHLGPAHNVLLWIIGHEIGHIANGHKVGHFAEANNFSEIMQFPEINADLEIEADRFALKSFENTEATAAFFWAIHEMIMLEINKILLEKGRGLSVHVKDFNEQLSLKVISKTHPPKLKRLLAFGVAINQAFHFEADYLEKININTGLEK